jgi:hypothetical protein
LDFEKFSYHLVWAREGSMTAQEEAGTAEYRAIYQQTLRDLTPLQKIEIARKGDDSLKCALCFDHDPHVIIALINSTGFGLAQARLVAAHHQRTEALEYLTRNPSFAGDHKVQMNLRRNPSTNALILSRLSRNKTLYQLYTLSSTQEVNERATTQARAALRQKYERSSPEQQAAFIIRTEGRCLRFFYKLGMETETARLFEHHKFASFVLVRNLLSFPGLPPEVLRGMSRAPFIWRLQGFRRQILHHTNCPPDVRARGGFRSERK